jgi:hypothetical protein
VEGLNKPLEKSKKGFNLICGWKARVFQYKKTERIGYFQKAYVSL